MKLQLNTIAIIKGRRFHLRGEGMDDAELLRNMDIWEMTKNYQYKKRLTFNSRQKLELFNKELYAHVINIEVFE